MPALQAADSASQNEASENDLGSPLRSLPKEAPFQLESQPKEIAVGSISILVFSLALLFSRYTPLWSCFY
jgi:hypothetical protein